MGATAIEIFERMRSDVEAVAWSAEDVDIDLEARYQAAILELGAVPFLAELFLNLGDSTLTRWLTCLDFVWEALPFSAWKEVLHLVAWNAPAVYQLVWSAAGFLGVDMVRVILDDREVDPVARDCALRVFPRGPPRSYSSLTGKPIIPPIRSLWRRMAAEGAPMIYDLGAS